jgi:hypothetical protein
MAGGIQFLSKQSRSDRIGGLYPGFCGVSCIPGNRWPSIWDRRRSTASSGYPWNWRRAAPVPIAGPSTVRLAPDGVCLALPVARKAVGSYPAVSPLPVALRPIGGLFSVALSVALPRPAVSWHSCPMVPGSSSGLRQRPPGPRLVRSRFRCRHRRWGQRYTLATPESSIPIRSSIRRRRVESATEIVVPAPHAAGRAPDA